MENLFIVMPAYNEEANIIEVVKSWYGILEKFSGEDSSSRMVIAPSGSTDNTIKNLKELKSNGYPKIDILEDTIRFHGPKVIALYDYAIENGADYIFQTDSDGQTNPDEFEDFWKDREKFDGIFGNRVVRGDGSIRAFVESIVCILVRLYFGVKVPDANAPFRLMKADTVRKYLYNMPSDYNLPNIMLTTYFSYYNERIDFREISFKPRRAGVNSVNIPRIIKIGLGALKDFSSFKRGMRHE